ncbi:hypothetical protein PMAYCL1PPCAC_30158, partial [Pristionchus mayeri]
SKKAGISLSLLPLIEMGKIFLLFTALVAGVSSFVYTCNEVKQILEEADFTVNGTRACVVLPESVKFPFNDEPYTSYLYNTYVVDTDTGEPYELSGLEENGSFCKEGNGPWMIKSDDHDQFKCSSAKYKYAEIVFIFTSDDPNIVQTTIAPTTKAFGKGTHVFVAPEGSLRIEKKSIDTEKETTFQLYSGAGQNEAEERFALMPEKFVAGASTVIIGPVTTLVIEDDVNLDLTLTSFEEDLFISAQPGFSFSVMTTGRANDLQSSRPNILVSTAYGINDDSFAYDAISITGTAKMDDDVGTLLTIDCDNRESGEKSTDIIDKTRDVIINKDCSSIDITYNGTLLAEEIGRSSEVIYLRIESSFDPVIYPSSDTTPKPTSVATPDVLVITTRRSLPPTSATSLSLPPSLPSTSRIPSTTTTKSPTTTSSTPLLPIHIFPIGIALLAVLQ